MKAANFGLILLLTASFCHAAAPAGEALWGMEPVEAVSSKRQEICLNGLWRFRPANQPATLPSTQPATQPASEPVEDWGYIRVPGDWRNTSARPGIVKLGAHPAWQAYNGDSVPVAIYERTVMVPAAWAGRAILLDFDRVSTDAIIYMDGKRCGTLAWPGNQGSIDITDAVTPGRRATLRLLVMATADESQAQEFQRVPTTQPATQSAIQPATQPMTLPTAQPRTQIGAQPATRPIFRPDVQPTAIDDPLESRGIIGDVTVKCRPKGPHISDVFVQTSTRRGEVMLEVDLADVRRAGAVRLIARMLNEKGVEEARFVRDVAVEAGRSQTVFAAWKWPDARLWDFATPNLYTVQLELIGAGIHDEFARRFGFREFWVDGRKFMLNGVEFRLRPSIGLDRGSCVAGTAEVIHGLITGQMKAGFNIEKQSSVEIHRRGTPDYRGIRARIADERGWPIMDSLPSVAPFMVDAARNFIWDEEDNRQAWQSAMRADVRNMRNHPSILMWATSAGFFGFAQDQNPVMIGRRDWTHPSAFALRAAQYGREAIGLVKKHDPTRPVCNHQGGFVGDLHSVNTHLNLIPLQEREEWLSHYAEHGKMPFMAGEFGTPLVAAMLRGRMPLPAAAQTEPLMTEFCAGWIGPDVYDLEPKSYRDAVRVSFLGEQSYLAWQGNPALETAPAFQQLQYSFITNTYRAWRTHGITGGMAPSSLGYGWQPANPAQLVPLAPFRPGRRGTYFDAGVRACELHYLQAPHWNIQPAGQAILDNNSATLAWIAGPKDAFTAKDHSFVAGQVIHKQIAVLNDTRIAQKGTFTYEATVPAGDGIVKTILAEGQFAIEPAQNLMLPIDIELPAHTGESKADGRIKIAVAIGQIQNEDVFDFRVFARPGPVERELLIYDPVGLTSKVLQLQGYALKPWKGEADVPLLFIGREALSRPLQANAPAAVLASIEAIVANGGRVIVFAQHPDFLRKCGFRVAGHLPRRVFPVAVDHPVVDGLDALDLRDWAGQGTLVEPRPDYLMPDAGPMEDGMPLHGWHWGNRGALCCAAIEKPHRSGWRPILECGFDLAYTPLMELDHGKGRLILNTLDFEDYAADPAAMVLLRNLVEYALRGRPSPRAPSVVLLGNNDDADRMDGLGVVYDRVNTLEAPAGVAIIGAGAKIDIVQTGEYLAAGGKVLFMRRDAPHLPDMTLKQVKDFSGATEVPDWPETTGLSPSDLRWRTGVESILLDTGPQLKISARGLLGRMQIEKGVVIFCQLDPDALLADTNTHLRYTRWRQTRAMAQLLANMGASFNADANFFAGRPAKWYHPDYRADFPLGDDPYRYFRW